MVVQKENYRAVWMDNEKVVKMVAYQDDLLVSNMVEAKVGLKAGLWIVLKDVKQVGHLADLKDVKQVVMMVEHLEYLAVVMLAVWLVAELEKMMANNLGYMQD